MDYMIHYEAIVQSKTHVLDSRSRFDMYPLQIGVLCCIE